MATRKQVKDHTRVMAWVNDEPFQENARAEKKVPELTAFQVLDDYVHMNPKYLGAFYTPPELATELCEKLADSMSYSFDNSDFVLDKILDPCAGIGHLLRPFSFYDYDIAAVELDEEAYQVGRKAFPQYKWIHANAFDLVQDLTGQFDATILNPPFNLPQTYYSPEDYPDFDAFERCKKSQHLFLDLAIRATKPGGYIALIGPYNTLDKMPQKERIWFDRWIEVGEYDIGKLDGDFKQTKINVHGFIMQRNENSMIDDLAMAEIVDKFEEEDAQPEQEVIEVEVKPENIKIGKYEMQTVDKEIYDVLVLANAECDINELASIRTMTAWLKLNKHKEVANWIKNNSNIYGYGFFNGFTDGENTLVMYQTNRS